MNIFGVGGMELVIILVIMMVVAGPKRMIQWAYVAGKYVAKFRVMWEQTVDLVQKEIDEAGVDVKLPKDIPTRQNVFRWTSQAVAPLTKPISSAMDEVKKEIDQANPSTVIKSTTDEINKSLKEPTTAASTKPAAKIPSENLGSWSAPEQTANGSDVAEEPVGEFGSWSK